MRSRRVANEASWPVNRLLSRGPPTLTTSRTQPKSAHKLLGTPFVRTCADVLRPSRAPPTSQRETLRRRPVTARACGLGTPQERAHTRPRACQSEMGPSATLQGAFWR